MASSFRAPRVILRLAHSASRPSPQARVLARNSRAFASVSRSPSSLCICIRCQLRLANTGTSTGIATRHAQRRTLTTSTTLTEQQNTTATETPKIPNPPDTTNNYTIFPRTLPAGPPPASAFDIDLPTLRREFLALQNTLHPDKYPPGPLKKEAETLSARINNAYRTLSDPLLRAQYILHEFHGIDVTAEDGAGQHPLDPELLMEVMDVQEAIEEVGEGEEAVKAIEGMKGENEERVRGCVGKMAEAFDKGDVQGAVGECVRLKFWVSVGEGLREWEPGMGGIRLVH
ncbi:HSCB C-terminal oligomerization domain-containing protein [Aspergillus pseudoustus]|uniref:HSCB C-terminal oligomerization domain-containing protein n=1 Tax=Aspergillus pseudoustus TaxID=1810923 RepID=A0ABR4KPR4_9EURO